MKQDTTFQLPQTADGWCLYCRLEGVEDTAEQLDVALSRALEELDGSVAGGARLPEAAAKAFEGFRAVADQHARYGATDTEPLDVARGYIERYINYRYGVDVELP